MNNYDVFVSYRRNGGEVCADLLYDQLTRMGLSVFRDREELHFGDFRRQLILNNLRSHCLVVVLSPGALDRCKNKGDWVKREIMLFLRLRKKMILLAFDGFEFPEDLPKEMGRLKKMPLIRLNPQNPNESIQKIGAILRKRWNHKDRCYITDMRKKYYDQEDNYGCYITAEEACFNEYRETSWDDFINSGIYTLLMLFLMVVTINTKEKNPLFCLSFLSFYFFSKGARPFSGLLRNSFVKGAWEILKSLVKTAVATLAMALVLGMLGKIMEGGNVEFVVLLLIWVTCIALSLYVVFDGFVDLFHLINSWISIRLTTCLRRRRRLLLWEDKLWIPIVSCTVLAALIQTMNLLCVHYGWLA